MKYLFIALIIIVVIAGCKSTGQGGVKVDDAKDNFVAEQPIDVSLRTSDDVALKGTFYPNSDSKRGLILLHQNNKDRTSYSSWINYFQKYFNILSIDFRGHGESQGEFSDLTNDDYIAMMNDAKAAQEYLVRKNILASDISFIGASIGSNTAQNFASNNEFDKVVLLSPGENYKGIVLSMKDNSGLAIASEEDAYSFQTLKKLQAVSPNSEFIYLKNKGHGTDMLDEELVQKIINYLNS